MKVKSLFFTILLISSIFTTILPFDYVYAVKIPPTPAIRNIETSNDTVQAMNYSTTLHLVGVNGTTVTGNNLTKTIYISANGSGGGSSSLDGKNLFGTFQWFFAKVGNFLEFRGLNLGQGLSGTQNSSTITLQTNFKVNGYTCPVGSHAFSYDNSTGQTTCTADSSSGGSTPTYDTIQNIGGGNASVYAGNTTKTNFQFKTLDNGTGIYVINGTQKIKISINFRVASKTCGGTDKISAYDNVTGAFTCSVDQTGITSATGQNNGNGVPVYTGNSGTHVLLFNTLRATYGLVWSANTTDNIISLTFKVNNVSCNAGFFVSSYDNSTGTYTCTAGNSGTITTASNIGTGGFGWFRDVTGSQINLRNLTTTRTDLFTLSQSINNVNLASSFKSDTFTCSAGKAVTSYDNSTGTYTCSAFGQGTITAVSNIGKGGKGFFKDISPSNQINLRNITSTRTDLITIAQNLTDVNIGSTFKSLTKTCPGGSAFTAFDNATGIFTCSSSGSGITSINSQTGPSITINNGPSHNVLITSASNTITIDANNTAQIKNLFANGVGIPIQASRDNATQNSIRSIICNGVLTCSYNATTIRLNNTGTNVGLVVSDVTSSRALNSTYQNTGGKPMFVVVTDRFHHGPNTQPAKTVSYTGTTNPPNINAGSAGYDSTTAVNGPDAISENVFYVPDTYFYNVTSYTGGTNTATLLKWTEYTVTGGGGAGGGIITLQGDNSQAQYINCQNGNTTCTNSTAHVLIGIGNGVDVLSKDQRLSGHKTIQNPLLNGLEIAQVSKTASYTATQNDIKISVNATACALNPCIVTLPSASSVTNQTYIILKSDYGTNQLMLKTNGGSIMGFSNINFTAAKDWVMVTSNGTGYSIDANAISDITSFKIKKTGSVRWSTGAVTAFTPTTVSPSTTTLNVSPYVVSKTQRIDTISIEVSTLIAGSTCRMALYYDNGTGYPSTLVPNSDVGTVSGASTGVKTNTFSKPILLQEGLYWSATQCSTATTILLRAIPFTALPNILGTVSTMGTTVTGVGWSATNTFGAFPHNYPTAGATVLITNVPEVAYRITG